MYDHAPYTASLLFTVAISCPQSQAICNVTIDKPSSEQVCVDKSTDLCDGVPQCPDGEDEQHCGPPVCSQHICPYSGEALS